MNDLFGFLFARPSFAEGIARTLDIGGTLQECNSSLTPEQADALALLADWRVIGDDLHHAMAQAGDEAGAQITEDLMAQANAELKSDDQLELALSDGR